MRVPRMMVLLLATIVGCGSQVPDATTVKQQPLDFLAEFTQHIPPKGSHLIRYYGWYSNKSRGMRKKADASAAAETAVESSTEESAATGSSQAWAMLIKRVYEVDPLCCPQCGGQMKVVALTT